MKATNLPLGQDTDYPQKYAPDVLFPIERAASREVLGLADPLPFYGFDIWNAWELTWLGPGDLPRVATAEIRVPADSRHIIESKSLKLYLGSFAMSRFESEATVADTIAKDLSACVDAPVIVRVLPATHSHEQELAQLEGSCLDELPVECSDWEVSPQLLSSDASQIVTESLHTHLLRSLCPVTGQPDIGSLLIRYTGPAMDRAGLLRYAISFREHNDFHEACIERMFVDLMARCDCETLTVYARYQRRGGVDINPFRSTEAATPDNLRLWRQ